MSGDLNLLVDRGVVGFICMNFRKDYSLEKYIPKMEKEGFVIKAEKLLWTDADSIYQRITSGWKLSSEIVFETSNTIGSRMLVCSLW